MPIVFLENTVRLMETGQGALEATLNSAREISFTILSMTISLAAVFIPLVFMSGSGGANLPRVLDHHRRGDLRQRHGIADADAADVLPAAGPARALGPRRPGWSGSSAAWSTGC